MNVAIVTDTSACLPKELVERYEIELVPMEFIYDGKVYRDEIDITPAEFYELLAQAKELPTTSAPPPGAYFEVFRKLAQKVKEILVITVSAKLSHTFDSARTAVEMAKEKLTNIAIKVLDCQTAAGAQGFVVLAAAKAAVAGKSLTQVVEASQNLMPKVHLIAFIDTLHYLAEGGRVPQVIAWASSLLKIKPIFELLPLGDGPIPVDRVRTRPKAIERLVELLKERADGKPIHAIVMHTNVLDEAEKLKERLTSEFNCVEIYVKDFTPVMGVHTGPGLLGIAFYFD